MHSKPNQPTRPPAEAGRSVEQAPVVRAQAFDLGQRIGDLARFHDLAVSAHLQAWPPNKA